MATNTIRLRCPECGISGSGNEAQLYQPLPCANCDQLVTMERVHTRPSEPRANTETTRDRRSAGPSAPSAERATALPQIISVLGSAALIGGAFAPFISVPLFGAITLFRGGDGDGVIIVILATIGLTFALLGRLTVTAITGVLSGIVAIVTFNNVTNAMEELSDNPFGDATSYQWGLALLLIGIVLTIAAPVVKRR